MHPEDQSDLAAATAVTADLLQRLRSASGHLQAVIAMIEVDEPCEFVLHQLEAVEAAIKCARRVLIQCQVEQSLDRLLNDSCPENQEQTLSELLSLYSLATKTRAIVREITK